MASVRIPRIIAEVPPAEFADETQQTVMNDAILNQITAIKQPHCHNDVAE